MRRVLEACAWLSLIAALSAAALQVWRDDAHHIAIVNEQLRETKSFLLVFDVAKLSGAMLMFYLKLVEHER
jgi:hypothetical protein